MKVGKFAACRGAVSSWLATGSMSSSLSIQGASSRPSPPLSASQRAMGTSSLPAGRSPAKSAGIHCQSLSMMDSPLMSLGIDALLERGEADTGIGVDELLVPLAVLHVDGEDFFDHVRHFVLVERGPEHVAETGVVIGAAAQLDLVELLTLLVDAEDTDIAHMVVAAGIHAAGDVEAQVAEIVEVVEIVEAALDGFRHRDRLGVGEGAEVPAGAADQVGEGADVGGGEPEGLGLLPELEQPGFFHVG